MRGKTKMILRKLRINKRDVAWVACVLSCLYFYIVGIPSLVEHLSTIMGLDQVQEVTILEAKELEVKEEEPLTVEGTVMKMVKEAGLNEKEAWSIIQAESTWRQDICIIEPNDTISCGLWQLNTVHNKKGLTNACKTDPICATEWAIEKRINDGNWCAWSQAKILGLCK